MRRWFQSRKVKLLVVGVVVFALAGGAFAYWTSTGSGSGTSTVGDAQAVSITFGTVAPTNSLFPGGTADVTGRISNPNSFQVKVARLNINTTEGTLGFEADVSHLGCNLSSLTFTAPLAVQNNGGLGWDVPATGTTDFHLTGAAVTMSTAAVDACQGATFTVHLQATAS